MLYLTINISHGRVILGSPRLWCIMEDVLWYVYEDYLSAKERGRIRQTCRAFRPWKRHGWEPLEAELTVDLNKVAPSYIRQISKYIAASRGNLSIEIHYKPNTVHRLRHDLWGTVTDSEYLSLVGARITSMIAEYHAQPVTMCVSGYHLCRVYSEVDAETTPRTPALTLVVKDTWQCPRNSQPQSLLGPLRAMHQDGLQLELKRMMK